jgi:hypothetical protein
MDTATAAFEKGGSAAQDMTSKLQHQQDAIDGNTTGFGSQIDGMLKWVGVNVLGQATLESATAAVKAHRDSLDAVGRAQLDATTAAGNYQKALDDQAAHRRGADEEVVTAQKALADATSNVKHAEDEAADATKNYAEKLKDLVNQLDSALNKDLAYSDALDNNIKKEKDLADAVKQHGAKSEEAKKAQDDLQKAYLATAEAAQAKATADNVGAGSEEAAKKGAEAYNIELSKLASQQKGPGRDAALGLIDRFNDSQLAAFNAGNATSGFGTKVLQLPSGRTVTIIADTGAALYSLEQIQNELSGIRDKNINIAINQIGGIPILPKAAGGPVSMGRTYLVGEKGPELLTMAGNGFVTPNDKLTGMLGNPSPSAQDVGGSVGGVNVSVYIDGQEFRGMIQTAISDDKRATKRTVSAGAGAAIV